MGDVRPILFGYQCLQLSSPARTTKERIGVLADFAKREGYALGSVYTDLDGDGRGLGHLLMAVRSGDGPVVAVAWESDLGRTLRFRQYVRGAIEEAGARLLVASAGDPTGPAVSAC